LQDTEKQGLDKISWGIHKDKAGRVHFRYIIQNNGVLDLPECNGKKFVMER